MDLAMNKVEIRMAYREEWNSCMRLAWKTFLQFEASDYSEEGIQNFMNFITDDTLYQMFVAGTYTVFVALVDDQIVGMISLRSRTHISLLFVDSKYHRQGIGSQLIASAWNYLQTELGETVMTVNAAPYGVSFYHKVGFKDTAKETTTDGITYTPMVYMGNK